MYQRPKINESDEDLLKLQEEFLKNKQNNEFKLASTLVSSKDNPAIPSSSIENDSSESSKSNEIQEHLDNTFEDIPKNIKIGDIIPKTQSGSISAFKLSRTGFPQAKRRDLTVSSGKGSIFSQQMKKLKMGTTKMEVDVTQNLMDIKIVERRKDTDASSSKIVLPEAKCLLDNVKQEIHLENIDKMNKMSSDEILAERERLMSTMDPAIIAFLKSKRHHNQPKVETRQPSIAQQNLAQGEVNIEEIESTHEILSTPQSEKWINFDILEGNKLAWMKNIPKVEDPKKEKYEARFDFAGWLLPYKEDEINDTNRSLYHHGEEPGRPGYTLQELFQLCRSNITQQKIVALNTIAAILNLHSSGCYDHIIEIPIEQIFFVLRFCLDENSPGTLSASIRAMRNLFCNTIDETCLDCLLGFALGKIQPNLAVDEMLDDNTVNDQQLAEQNLVKCLYRSGILIRIRYIFNVVKPSDVETVVNCLDLLIRLARDAEFIAEAVFDFDGLMISVVENFLPKVVTTVQSTTAYETPIIQAVKLFRVLASRNQKMATLLNSKYKVLDSIATYLTNDNLSLNTMGLKLQIESLQLWETFAFYGLTIDYFKVLRPILLRLIDYHVKNTNVDSSWTLQTHYAAICNLLAEIAKHDYFCVLEYVKILFEAGLPKWMTQFLHLSTFSCGRLQLLSSLFHLITTILQQQPANVQLPWANVYNLVEKMLISDAFKMVTTHIKSSSNILNNYELHKSSPNLKFAESVAWNTADHIVPVLQTKSCIPFVCKLVEFVTVSTSNELKLCVLRHENISSYLKEIRNSTNFYMTANWYTKMEAVLIVDLLKMAVQVASRVDTAQYYEVAVKSLCLYTPEMKHSVEYLFKNIIFCKSFYPSDVLLRNLNLDNESVLKTALEDIGNIQKVYMDVLGLQRNLVDLQTKRTLNISQGNIMPLDWIYSPIIALYSNNEVPEVTQNFIISNCLRWIHIYETCFPELADMINPTDKFCRLACTYLGSDTLFLLPEIQVLLRTCLEQILGKHEEELDFDKAIHGLKSFQDLYIQLLEQYQGVSYGDKLFGQFLLVPLAQRHNLKYRKAIWSEYAGIIQIFNVTPDEIMLDINKYLSPIEDDESLLRCYQHVVSTGVVRKFSVFYKIATHHLEAVKMTKQVQ